MMGEEGEGLDNMINVGLTQYHEKGCLKLYFHSYKYYMLITSELRKRRENKIKKNTFRQSEIMEVIFI